MSTAVRSCIGRPSMDTVNLSQNTWKHATLPLAESKTLTELLNRAWSAGVATFNTGNSDFAMQRDSELCASGVSAHSAVRPTGSNVSE